MAQQTPINKSVETPMPPTQIPTGIPGISFEKTFPVNRAEAAAPDLPVAFDRSPKVRFQRGQGNIERHRQLLDNPAYDKGRDFTLLELVRKLVQMNENGISTEEAASRFYRIVGAVEQQIAFQDLSEVPLPPKQRALSTQNLNHLA